MCAFLPSTNFETALIIMGSLVIFYTYFYFIHSQFLKKIIQKKPESSRQLWKFFLQKLFGTLFLGIIPALMYSLLLNGSFNEFGLTFQHLVDNLRTISILVIVIVIILFTLHKKKYIKNTLQINVERWNLSLYLWNVLGWSLYLFAYEFLFRGILLFSCEESFGFWSAIAINVTLYSAIHMVNGKDQTQGALFFGTIACYFTLTNGTLLIPVFMHIALSIFSDYFSIRMNPAIGFVKVTSINR